MPAPSVSVREPLCDLGGLMGGEVVEDDVDGQSPGTDASICLKNLRTSVPVCPFWQWVRTSPVATFIAANRSVVPLRL